MEYRTEEGDPLLKLRYFIVTHPIHWYYNCNYNYSYGVDLESN